MKDIDLRTVDRATLKDIKDVVIDTSKPCAERVKDYIAQIGNPYCFLDDDIVVQICYADTDVSLHDRLLAYLSTVEQAGFDR